jgi:hypothetical protein
MTRLFVVSSASPSRCIQRDGMDGGGGGMMSAEVEELPDVCIYMHTQNFPGERA